MTNGERIRQMTDGQIAAQVANEYDFLQPLRVSQ